MTQRRSKSGRSITKRYDTQVGTIERLYGVDLGVRSDKKLGDYLEEKGYRSLAQMLKDK